jgi:putative SOS response-associated peptidase YedK
MRLPIDLLRPFDSEQLKAWKVSTDVGNVKNDRPDLIDVQPESKAPPESLKLFSS